MKNIIKEKRTEVNMTITMLSKLIGSSEETLLSWESGASEPSIPEMIRLSQIFNIQIDDLVAALADQKKNNTYDDLIVEEVVNNKENEVNQNNSKTERQIIIFSLVLFFLTLIFILSRVGSVIGSGSGLDYSEASSGERYALEILSERTFNKPNVSD